MIDAAAQETLQAGLITAATEICSSDERVAALWLGGSLGRGAGDHLSDVDLVLVARSGRVHDLVIDLPRLAAALGPVALFHEAPQNAPVEGAQANVLYDTSPLPIYVDWNVWPAVETTPSDVATLYGSVELPVAAGETWGSMLSLMARGTNSPLASRLELFRLFMTPMLMKCAARGGSGEASRILEIMRLDATDVGDVEDARAIALDVLAASSGQPAAAVDCVRRYVISVVAVGPRGATAGG